MWCMDTCRGALCPPSPATCLSPAVLLGADGEQHPCMRGLPLCSYSGGNGGAVCELVAENIYLEANVTAFSPPPRDSHGCTGRLCPRSLPTP